ncbi:MAG: hypothetical protein CME15_05795 [Gemmatimonadetes bacterium]|nr:hypothetical protein [Gemmatimonadota bacterium]
MSDPIVHDILDRMAATCPPIAEAPTLFLEGPAGAGKTTHAMARIQSLIEGGVAPGAILLLTPHRSYSRPYEDALGQATCYALGLATVGGLARRYVSLFWPAIPPHSTYPFSASLEPIFLTYEVAQYFMARLVSPLVEQGYFADLKLTRHRLYSQLLDSLNKSAVNDIPLDDLGSYLEAARISEETADGRVDEISSTLVSYRKFCAQYNLIDFSLYLELFKDLIRKVQPARDYLFAQYQHVVYDNCEEDVPLAHDFVRYWMRHPASRLQSVLVIYDREAGFRKLLGANPRSAYTLREECGDYLSLEESPRVPTSLRAFGRGLVKAIANTPLVDAATDSGGGERRFHVYSDRLHHQMVQRVVAQVGHLVESGRPPQEMAVISPFLSDSFYHALADGLERVGISCYGHRPSRSLRDEPVTKVLLTLTTLAHPSWGLARPSREAVSHMFSMLLKDADLVRSAVLAAAVYEGGREGIGLKPFEGARADMRDRVTYRVGETYEQLRIWLEVYASGDELPIDHFLSRLFGELLSQPRFGFYRNVQAGAQVGSSVESACKFRRAVGGVLERENEVVGKAYVEMVQEGVVSAFYAVDGVDPPEAVLIAPAHTFLLRNRSYAHQFWLDVGSTAWHRRIHQPLTNPYVLSADWNRRDQWSAAWERRFETERLTCIVAGLIRRCTDSIYLYASELSAHGQEQTGDLLVALGYAMRELALAED